LGSDEVIQQRADARDESVGQWNLEAVDRARSKVGRINAVALKLTSRWD